jgi:uncharacterized protein YjgD (DUF1641 family)
MKKLTQIEKTLHNEANKNEVANELLHHHNQFLKMLSEITKCADTKQTIKNFLVIIEGKADHLNKLYKIK